MYCDLYSTEMETFRCKLCSMKFKTEKYFKAHLKTKRHLLWSETKSVKRHRCYCGKVFSHRQSLYLHKKSCNCVCVEDNKVSLKLLLVEEQQQHEQEVEKQGKRTNQQLREVKLVEPYNEVSELKEEIKQLKDKIAEINTIRFNKRRGINKHVRKEVICKQNSQCNTCSKPLTEYNTNVDHKIGVQFGGTNDEDNLQALCVECHSEKTIKERRNRKRIHDAIQQILSE